MFFVAVSVPVDAVISLSPPQFFSFPPSALPLLSLSAVSDHGVRPPGSLPAGASAGVPVQSARPDGETCPGVCHDRVDEQATPLLRTVRG